MGACPLLAQSGHRSGALHMSAIGGKADMTLLHCKCPLMTQSGHRIRAQRELSAALTQSHLVQTRLAISVMSLSSVSNVTAGFSRPAYDFATAARRKSLLRKQSETFPYCSVSSLPHK